MKENKRLTIEAAQKADFAEAFEDMRTHFRKSELKSYEKFISLIDDKKYVFLQIKDRDKKIGYMLVFIEPTGKFLVLEYFVIKKEFQSMGYGTKALEALKSHFPDMNGIFLEVEHANEALPNTIKRIKFYERSGTKKLDLKYIHPNGEGGRPMHLFFLPIKKDFPLPSKKETLKVIKEAFEYLHGHIPEINQIYEKILNA